MVLYGFNFIFITWKYLKNSKDLRYLLQRHFNSALLILIIYIFCGELMTLNPLTILSALAVVLIGSLVGCQLAAKFNVPRVTGYLVIGLLAGPSFAKITGLPTTITPQALNELQILTDIALVLILVTIGGQFRTENLRRWHKRIIYFSLAEVGLTFLLVAVTTFSPNHFIVQ